MTDYYKDGGSGILKKFEEADRRIKNDLYEPLTFEGFKILKSHFR